MRNLLFCMTPGQSLSAWKRNGCYSREIKPYIEYASRGYNVRILTFEKENVKDIGLVPGIELCRFKFHPRLLPYLPIVHSELGKWAHVIKTNQSFRAWNYVLAAKIWRKPILLRCGYVHGEYLETTRGLDTNVSLYQFFEGRAFRSADRVMVASPEMRNWIKENYKVDNSKISVIPNFVDLNVFRPQHKPLASKVSIVSVGRLHPIKRFDILIAACAQIKGCRLTIVGDGPEKKRLKQIAAFLGVNLELPGNIPNEYLPSVLCRGNVFAMTSAREGNPKALIEAMACGIPCVAVRAKGVDNLINNGEDGLLTSPIPELIAGKLLEVLNDDRLARKLSDNAIKKVKCNNSFNVCFNYEITCLKSLINDN